jgi:hypothetical protein
MSNPFSNEIGFSIDLFVGRSRELCSTLDRLANPQSRVSSAVYGEAGIGKSWFLERIRHSYTHVFTKWEGEEFAIFEWEGDGDGITLIPLNCEEITPWTPEAFWRTIWQHLQSKNVPSSEPEIVGKLLSSYPSDNLLIGQLLDQITKNGRFLILLLDNFEWVIKNMDPDNPDFLNKMRSLLVREHKGLGVVLVTAESLEDLCNPIHFAASPFDNVFYPVELKRFTEAEAYDFIETRLMGTGVCFSEKEKQDLFQVSHGHPAQLRELCHRLFEDRLR